MAPSDTGHSEYHNGVTELRQGTAGSFSSPIFIFPIFYISHIPSSYAKAIFYISHIPNSYDAGARKDIVGD